MVEFPGELCLGTGLSFVNPETEKKNRSERFRLLRESIKDFLRVFYPEFDRKVEDGDFEIYT